MLGHPSIWNKKKSGFLEQCKNVISLQLSASHDGSTYWAFPVRISFSDLDSFKVTTASDSSNWKSYNLACSDLVKFDFYMPDPVHSCNSYTECQILQNVKYKDWIGHIMLGFISYSRGMVKQRLCFLQKALPISFKPCMFVT